MHVPWVVIQVSIVTLPASPDGHIQLNHSLDASTSVSYQENQANDDQSSGIPPNLTNHKGDTLLMLAAYHGHAETTKMLLDKGADPNVLNDRGQSPIAGAVFKGSDDVVRLLFERKADVYVGQPNAVDSAHMFRKEDYLTLFGVAQQ